LSIIEIQKYGEEVLRKPCKEVHKFTSKTRKLIDDLLATMYAANGVGLAAPQIGISQRVFVIDVATGNEPPNPMVFVNPRIVKKEGAVLSYEGCLSFPDVYTHVKRYEKIIVRAKDHKNKPFSIEVDDGSLLCRAIQHETDHLDGILFVDHTMNRFETNKALQEKALPPVQDDYLLEETELEELIMKKCEEKLPSYEEEELTEKSF
jgi:peptide deformylase